MKVILTKDVQNLGHAGEVKEVSDGYAKNFLIPGGYAKVATEGIIRNAEAQKAERAERAKEELERAKGLADKMQGQAVIIKAKADETGKKLYAAIKPEEIADALLEKGFEVDKNKIEIPQPIKEVGEFEVSANLEHGLEVAITVTVEAQ
jgi:large subunit ribosomal protein L9